MEIRKKAVAKNSEPIKSQVPYESFGQYSNHTFDGSVLNQYSFRIRDVVEKMEQAMEKREKEQRKLFLLFFGMSAFGIFLLALGI